MRRSTPTLILALAVAALVTAIFAGGALAYFSTTGIGSASAGVTSIATPTISSATPGGGTVTLVWGAVAAPGPGTVTYSVSRDGGEPAGDCPSAASPTSVTTCTDSGVGIGSHSYMVTASWRSWSATSSPAAATVTSGPATHFTLTATTSTPAAGAADNLTITALDASNNSVTTYAGSHSLTFSGAANSPGGNAPTVVSSGGTATAFGTATAINFSNGVATVSSSKNGVMKVYRAAAASITVSDGTISNPVALALTVTPLAASKLSLSAATTTPTAGAADNLTTSALDTYGNIAPTYTGSHNVTFSGAANSPNATVPTITNSSGTPTNFGSAVALSFSAGVATVSGSANGTMTLYKSGATSITASDGSFSASALVLTVAGSTAIKFTLSASSNTPAAGAVDNLTTTAIDTYGNTATPYTGSHELTFSGAASSPGGIVPTVADSNGNAINFGTATAINFTNGVATVSSSKNGAMKLYKAGATSIAVSDGSISTEISPTVTVSVGAAAKFGFTNVVISAGVAAPPCLFTCVVTGLGNAGTIAANVSVTDTYGNTVSGLGGGHAATVTTNGGTIVGGTLTIASSGPAESTTRFTFTAQASGAFTDKLTAAKSSGTTYTSATVEASR
jgi:hypothetical protein